MRGVVAAIPIHVVVVGLAADALVVPRRAREAPAPAPIADSSRHTPIEVQLVVVDDRPGRAAGSGTAPTVRRSTVGRVASAPASSSAEPAPRVAPPAPLGLRVPDSIEVALTVATEPPTEPVPSGLLDPAGTRYRSRAFDVVIAPDGSARIRDNPNFRWGPDRTRPRADERPPTREEDIERPILNPVRPFGVTIATFDVTDWAMRSRGIDPYASQKLAVLDATRDERARIGALHRRDQLARTPDLVRESLVAASKLPDAAQKRALFELWDDCAETGPAELVAAGAAARAAIAAHIRTRFPAGSPRQLTAAELAAFAKQQRSRTRFDPYGSPGENSNG